MLDGMFWVAIFVDYKIKNMKNIKSFKKKRQTIN